jgi:hypothetical protein
MRTKWWAGALLVTMPWLLAACNDDDKVDSSQSASEAEAALCQQLTTLKAPIEQIKTLDPAKATVGDVKELTATFVNSVKSIDIYRAKVKAARVDDFEDAIKTLDTTLKTVNDDTTLQAAGDNAKSAADGVRSAWTEAVDGLGCKKQ